MPNSSEKGPLCIFSPDKKLCLRTFGASELEKLLAPSEDLRKLKVVVVSVAGRYRQGKSFLLNFMLRYLKAGGDPNWLNQNDNLEGFTWRHSRESVTQGVLLWPEVFKMRRSNGEEVAVLLMDSQGVFDTKTTIQESTAIFAFSVLLSSVQIFNVKQNIQGDDLSQLELFTKFGQLIANSKGSQPSSIQEKPFQEIVFLVRDWIFADDLPYGWKGGQSLLSGELEKQGLTGELHSMRQNIKTSFDKTRCYLMPYPGGKVASSKDFNGHIADIKPDFIEHLRDFITTLFVAESLVPKRFNGQELTLGDFFIHVETYARTFTSEDLPLPQTLYDATVAAANNALLQKCFDLYYNEMTANVHQDRPLEAASFDETHRQASRKSLELYASSMKMGEQYDLDEILKKLNEKTEVITKRFREQNDAALSASKLKDKLAHLTDNQTELEKRVQEGGEVTAEMKQELDRLRCDRDELKNTLDQTISKLADMQNAHQEGPGFFGGFLGGMGETLDNTCVVS